MWLVILKVWKPHWIFSHLWLLPNQTCFSDFLTFSDITSVSASVPHSDPLTCLTNLYISIKRWYQYFILCANRKCELRLWLTENMKLYRKLVWYTNKHLRSSIQKSVCVWWRFFSVFWKLFSLYTTTVRVNIISGVLSSETNQIQKPWKAPVVRAAL